MSHTEAFLAQQIIKTINTELQVDLRSSKRTRELVYMRYVCYHVIRKRFPLLTLIAIGNLFNKDHATVIHGLEMYESLKNYDDFAQIERKVMETVKYYPKNSNVLCNPMVYEKNV